MTAKTDIRAAVLARRRRLPPEARAAAAKDVQAHLSNLVRRLRPDSVTGYVPVGSEPGGADLPDAIVAALAGEGELLLPVLRKDLDLDWASYAGPGTLVAAGRGMREPVGGRRGVAAVATADLVVVPALAVDHRGVRLGRGGGSYDRALARVGSGTLIVALLHDGELVERLPAEPHDRPVDAVITASRGLLRLPLEGAAGAG
ncbi:MAG TPA: 5-formyltetrahydrofolate cyclo-ligase [Micromonosporaceae bacterium]|nr:5-formyltetrahydrofolate cyclo-ligase [Micromonosporaceae bacterium]